MTLCPRKVVGCVGRLLGKEVGAKLSNGSSPLHTPEKASSTLHVEAKLCKQGSSSDPSRVERRQERKKEGRKEILHPLVFSLAVASSFPDFCFTVPPTSARLFRHRSLSKSVGWVWRVCITSWDVLCRASAGLICGQGPGPLALLWCQFPTSRGIRKGREGVECQEKRKIIIIRPTTQQASSAFVREHA